jgi:beta-1,4-N-acetylglucosaminyltransferase
MRNSPERADVLLVCTAGGHLLQRWALRHAWAGYGHAWVVASHGGGDVESLLNGERVFFAHSPGARNLKNLARNLLLARRLLRRLRPKIMMTTGAAVAVPFAWLARAYGIRVIYIESLARADSPSLSCRLVAPVADRIYVQWPELLRPLRRARYAGTVFSER